MYIIYGCFHATDNGERDCMAHKNLNYLQPGPLQKKFVNCITTEDFDQKDNSDHTASMLKRLLWLHLVVREQTTVAKYSISDHTR